MTLVGFVLDTKNHHNARCKLREGDTFYKIAAALTKKSAHTIDVNGKQSSAIPNLSAIKPKNPETQPYSIITHQLSRENNIAPDTKMRSKYDIKKLDQAAESN